jgi:hypothetical protein
MKLVILFAVLFFTLNSLHIDAAEKTQVVLSGVPTKVKFSRNHPDPLFYGAYFKFTLKKIELVTGEWEVPNSLVLEVTASHKKYLKGNNRLVFLLEVGSKNDVRVVTWANTHPVVCFNKTLVEKIEEFDRLNRNDGYKCAYTK